MSCIPNRVFGAPTRTVLTPKTEPSACSAGAETIVLDRGLLLLADLWFGVRKKYCSD